MAERKKKRYSSADDDEEELDTSEAIKFSQAGSIKRLKFINFMQYTEVEFQCGPNLNVIIGKWCILQKLKCDWEVELTEIFESNILNGNGLAPSDMPPDIKNTTGGP